MSSGFFVFPHSAQAVPRRVKMSADKKSVVFYAQDGEDDDVVVPLTNVRHLIRVNGYEWRALDRCVVVLHEKMVVPGVTGETIMLVVYFNATSIGVTTKQRELLQGKRLLEAEDAGPSKRQRTLAGRLARSIASSRIKNEVSRRCEIDESLLLKMGHVSEVMNNIVEVFQTICPGVSLSTVTATEPMATALPLYVPGAEERADDPFRLVVSDDGALLVMLRRTPPARHQSVVFASDVEFLLVGEDVTDESDDGSVDLEQTDRANMYAVVLRRKEDGGVAHRVFQFGFEAGANAVVQMLAFAAHNEIPHFATIAPLTRVLALDLAAVCEAAPIDLAPDGETVLSGPLAGLVQNVPATQSDAGYSESDDDTASSSVEYDDAEDELDKLEGALAQEDYREFRAKVEGILGILQKSSVLTGYCGTGIAALTKHLEGVGLWAQVEPFIDGFEVDE